MNGQLVMSTEKMINIGDYIQGLAAAQFFDVIDVYIERERIGQYRGKRCNMIMNGWYMHHPQYWPPSQDINPLFVSLHINTSASEYLLNEKGVTYLKQHEPIGCRDFNTMNMLKKRGVDAYFSGCLTLTLGRRFKTTECDGKVYFVDPICHIANLSLLGKIKFFLLFLRNIINITRLLKKSIYQTHSLKSRLQHLTAFYTEYSKLLPHKDIMSAEYITHEIPPLQVDKDLQQHYMNYAQSLIMCYSKAKLVVTSRIHCALPCLGLETPVIYVDYAQKCDVSGCRLDGLLELFNVATWSEEGVLHCEHLNIAMNSLHDRRDFNSNSWVKLSTQLSSRCMEFVKGNY